MDFELNTFRLFRIRRGLSQFELARLSNVSLASIQNMEAGIGNPTLSTVTSVSKVLGLKVELKTVPADWKLFAKCGAPIMEVLNGRLGKGYQSAKPNADMLIRCILDVSLELMDNIIIENGNTFDFERKKDALQAILLALHDHYPTDFKNVVMKSPVVKSLYPKKVTGRLLKLRRLALASIAEYM